MKKYKYGISILTNDKAVLDELEIKNGIYFAVELPDESDSQYIKWINTWLQNSKDTLTRKLKESDGSTE